MRAGFESTQEFDKNFTLLEEHTIKAIGISGANNHVMHTGRQNRALFLLSKLIAHNMSMMAIVDCYRKSPAGNALLDHFSIAALSRTSIDASLMTMYISHPNLTRAEWNLRRYVLYLHDASNRKRFFNALPELRAHSSLPNYKTQKSKLTSKIERFAKEAGLPADAIPELTTGQKVFVNGARGAVREASWDTNQFEFNQAYLSAFVHSHPVSFMRAEEHEISFSDPADYQLHFCAIAMGMAASYTEDVYMRMESFAKDFAADPLGQVDD